MHCDVSGTRGDAEETDRDSGWITVTRKRSVVKKTGGSLGAKTTVFMPTAGAPTPGCRDFKEVKKNIIRGSRMPPLPREETKVIVRPRGGLCISKLGPVYRGRRPYGWRQGSIRMRQTWTQCALNLMQNIMVISTPSQENATRYVNVEAITVAGQAPRSHLCGGKHVTASRECKHRYQTPYVVRRRRGLRARVTQGRSPSFEVDAALELNGCQQDQPGLAAPGGRSRSRGRSRTRGDSRSRSTSRARRKSRSRSRARSKTRARSGSRVGAEPRSSSRVPFGPSSRPDQGRADAACTGSGPSPKAGYGYAPGLKLSAADHANEEQGSRKSNLSWAARTRSSDCEQTMQCHPPQSMLGTRRCRD
ncbi:hypothetical protein HPB50_013638 [Hyalomma asiaticum]|uniref:Uncharacterized protein n=1 Tax=Hyalomma asiaticum TaxID=266040 RepID=A0ACB7S3M6_HYAAI|nr:hypothetical protein HPB50_013638 [Hyalomma asiaticum]